MNQCYAVTMRLLTVGLVSMTAACSGKDGAAGATGPQGSTGTQGPPGPEGNANVQADTMTLTNSGWAWNSQYAFQTSPTSYTEYFTRYHDAGDTTITSAVLMQGMVLVYFTPSPTTSTVQWLPLPYQFTDGSGNFNYEMTFETMPDTVRLHYFFVALNSNPIPTLSTYDIPTYQFKIVAVTGTLANAMRASHVNLKSYEAVSSFIARAKRSEEVHVGA